MKKSLNNTIIPDPLIKTIQKRLYDGKQIRRTLPQKGRLHIDQILPFLIVYRRPLQNEEKGTARLVRSESSYLIGSTSMKMKPSLNKLVETIADTLSQEKEAFLLIEIWSIPVTSLNRINENNRPSQGFRIFTQPSNSPKRTIEVLRKALKRVIVHKCLPEVEVVYQNKIWPPKLTPLIPSKTVKKMNWFTVGLEISPIYCNPSTGEVYPLVLRSFHRKLSLAIKRAIFEFLRSETTIRPKHYLSLGKRKLAKAVWEVDKELANVSNLFDFLLQVSPTNTESAWLKFKRGRFQTEPSFEYRPLPIDPSLVKSQLYKISIEKIEDPAIADIFYEKRLELDRKLNMLTDQGTSNFFYGSLQLFGTVSQEQVSFAKNILSKFRPYSHDESAKNFLGAGKFAELAKKEINYYAQKYPGFKSNVLVCSDVTGLMVSRGNLLIGKNIKIPALRTEALLQHEIGTHVLTHNNGRLQPFKQLYTGLNNYDEIQEGLAVISEYLVGGLTRPRLRILAGQLIATYNMIQGASFIDTFRELDLIYNFNQYTAFSITARVYRSGGLTKDAVYLRSLLNILKYLGEEDDFNILFIGKISFSHIPLIKELIHRQVLTRPPILPRYLDNQNCVERLESLKDGRTVFDLIERRKRK